MRSEWGEIGAVVDAITSDDGRVATVSIDGASYELARLGWAARDRVTHGAVTVERGVVELSPLEFATALLADSLIAVTRDGERERVTAGWLERAPAPLGDRLLAAAVHVNRRRSVEIDERPGAGVETIAIVGGARYLLSPLTWGERNRLIAGATRGAVADPSAFHAGVLQRVCASADGQRLPDGWLDELDADVGDALLDIALRISGLSRADGDDIATAIRAGRPHDAVTLHALCAEFGWTPSQVREQLAADIDAVMAVRGAVANPPPETRLQPSPSGRDGDTLIMIVDDDGAAR